LLWSKTSRRYKLSWHAPAGNKILIRYQHHPSETPRAVVTQEVLLRYLGNDSIALRGPHTGRAYRFAGTGATTIVQPQDVVALLRTQLFARVSSDES
jgi:hypothetical protein